jgi:hypothetical protein
MTPDQAADVRTLTRQAGISPIRTTVVPGAPALLELTGPHAPLVAPAPDPVVDAGSSRTAAGTASGTASRSASGRGLRSAGGSGRSRSGQGRSGQARTGQAASGPARSGPAPSGQQAPGSGARRRRRPRRPAA